MKYTVILILGWVIGMATEPIAESIFNIYIIPNPIQRACLDGDECFMTIRPKDRPWLNLTCTLTEPILCEEGEKPK